MPSIAWIPRKPKFTQNLRRGLSIIGVLDIIAALTLICLCISQLFYISIYKKFRLERLDYWQGFVIIWGHSLLVVCINGIQILAARELMKGIDQNKKDPTGCIQATELWLRSSAFLTITLALKSIVFIFITYAIHDNILRIFWLANILAVLIEITLRSVGFRLGRKFLEKLPIIRTTRISSFKEHIVTIV